MTLGDFEKWALCDYADYAPGDRDDTEVCEVPSEQFAEKYVHHVIDDLARKRRYCGRDRISLRKSNYVREWVFEVAQRLRSEGRDRILVRKSKWAMFN
jgi:hypothetical protein